MASTYTIEVYDGNIYEVWENGALIAFTGTQQECQDWINAQ